VRRASTFRSECHNLCTTADDFVFARRSFTRPGGARYSSAEARARCASCTCRVGKFIWNKLVQGVVEIVPGFSTRGYPARPLRRFVRSPGHQSRVVPCCRRARALRCSRRRHTVVLSCGVACSAHGEQRGGSVRRLRTRSGDEPARSPAMPRPPPSMMPSLRRPCGRPSCSSAAICCLAAAGRPENQ